MPFQPEDRFNFICLHAYTMTRVITRHLRMGFLLEAIEKRINGCRVDLVFKTPLGTTRVNEVKSARELREVHRIQAALYWQPSFDEIVLSNGREDIILPLEYVRNAQEQAEAARNLLLNRPDEAASTYRPNKDICSTCANVSCPFCEAKD